MAKSYQSVDSIRGFTSRIFAGPQGAHSNLRTYLHSPYNKIMVIEQEAFHNIYIQCSY